MRPLRGRAKLQEIALSPLLEAPTPNDKESITASVQRKTLQLMMVCRACRSRPDWSRRCRLRGDNLDHALLWTVNDGTNTTPSAMLVATSRAKARVGRSVSMQASFTDPDNRPWSYLLEWGGGSPTTDSVLTPGIIPGISPHFYNTLGNFEASLSVTDGNGATGTSSNVTVKVR